MGSNVAVSRYTAHVTVPAVPVGFGVMIVVAAFVGVVATGPLEGGAADEPHPTAAMVITRTKPAKTTHRNWVLMSGSLLPIPVVSPLSHPARRPRPGIVFWGGLRY